MKSSGQDKDWSKFPFSFFTAAMIRNILNRRLTISFEVLTFSGKLNNLQDSLPPSRTHTGISTKLPQRLAAFPHLCLRRFVSQKRRIKQLAFQGCGKSNGMAQVCQIAYLRIVTILTCENILHICCVLFTDAIT